MAEPRRVPLLPVQSSISNEQLASSQSKDNASGEATGKKADGEKQKTFRLEISLTTSNEKHCPEYSYVDLIKEKQARVSIFLHYTIPEYSQTYIVVISLDKYLVHLALC